MYEKVSFIDKLINILLSPFVWFYDLKLKIMTTDVLKTGGGRGIRTLDSLAAIVVFKTTALDHYAIPPKFKVNSSDIIAINLWSLIRV